MPRIITLTVNPALDKSTFVNALVPDKKLRCANPVTEPGGGGINVSRALKHLGYSSVATYFAGGYSGDFFNSLMDVSEIQRVVVPVQGETRENFIVVDTSANLQYRFGMEGPTVTQEDCSKWFKIIEQTTFDYLVASGSLAPGMSPLFFKQLASIVNRKKARLIIDTSGDALKEAVDEGVFMIKPNLGELSSLYGSEELSEENAVKAATDMVRKGFCEVIVVSMGSSGAMLVTRDELHKIHPPTVRRKSTVGAGDSMVAGMLAGIIKGYNWRNVLCYGIAAGTAATLNPGTALCKKDDVERLFGILQQQ